jgi:hypothetical protein
MLNRLPNLPAVLQVYAVIAVMLSGWTIVAFLWKLSAWLLLLTLGEISAIFSYGMAANFLESLIVLSLLLAAAVLLPAPSLRADFALRGSILAIGLIGALMAFVGMHRQFGMEAGLALILGPVASLVVTGFVLVLVSRQGGGNAVRAGVLWISDRLTIFLYILLPLFLISSAYVVVRNLG